MMHKVDVALIIKNGEIKYNKSVEFWKDEGLFELYHDEWEFD